MIKRVRNEEFLIRVKENRTLLNTISKRKRNGWDILWIVKCLLMTFTDSTVDGKRESKEKL